MVRVSTSLFTVPSSGLVAAVQTASATDMFHIDVTDGEFVKDKDGGASLFWEDRHIRRLRGMRGTAKPLDIHLMVADPFQHIDRYARHGPRTISFHLEADDSPLATAERIREHGVSPSIALNPDTPLERVEPLLPYIDMVLVMSVVPGKGGQGYIPETTERVRELRERIDRRRANRVRVQVDGGIKVENAYRSINAGADIIVSGTGVYNHPALAPNDAIANMKDVIAIGSDHGGYELKQALKAHCDANGISYRDFGCFNTESVDYPEYAGLVAAAIQSGEYQRGVLVCGTGIGISIAANKYTGIRAGVCRDTYTAEMFRRHNGGNVLCLGGRTTPVADAIGILDVWRTTPFEGGRHARRLEKIREIEGR